MSLDVRGIFRHGRADHQSVKARIAKCSARRCTEHAPCWNLSKMSLVYCYDYLLKPVTRGSDVRVLGEITVPAATMPHRLGTVTLTNGSLRLSPTHSPLRQRQESIKPLRPRLRHPRVGPAIRVTVPESAVPESAHACTCGDRSLRAIAGVVD